MMVREMGLFTIERPIEGDDIAEEVLNSFVSQSVIGLSKAIAEREAALKPVGFFRPRVLLSPVEAAEKEAELKVLYKALAQAEKALAKGHKVLGITK